MLLYYRCGLGFFMLIVHLLTNLHLPKADTMQFYIKQTHWITLMQICTNEKKIGTTICITINCYYCFRNEEMQLQKASTNNNCCLHLHSTSIFSSA